MRGNIKKAFRFLGPGFIAGAADDDPSALGSYSQTGAQFGYRQLWTALFSLPFLISVQEMAGRIGMSTGKGLARIIKEHYPRELLYTAVFLLTAGNVIFIGADLGAMASSAQLLIPIPFTAWLAIMAALILALEIFSTYIVYSRFLKYLALSLSAYFFTAFVIAQDWGMIARAALIPHFSADREFLLNVAAIIGTRASPYMFFWQPSQEVEEEIAQHKLGSPAGNEPPAIDRGDVKRMRVNTALGMFFSGFLMFFIIITTAATLGVSGLSRVETADQAAAALKPLAGNFAFLLFAAGVIGTGLLAIPVLAGSAAYAVSDALGWEWGLHKTLPQARGFYGVIIAAVLAGLLINLSPVRPFRLLYYAGIVNGGISPVLMLLLMLIANNRKIVGECANSPLSNITGWIMIAASAAVPVVLIVTLLS